MDQKIIVANIWKKQDVPQIMDVLSVTIENNNNTFWLLHDPIYYCCDGIMKRRRKKSKEEKVDFFIEYPSNSLPYLK